MKPPIFTGSCTAMVTPYSPKDGSIDYARMDALLEMQVKGGTAAVVICGTTGENATQPIPEHEKLVEHCIEVVNGRMKVIAGVGSNDSNSALGMAKSAKAAGADGLLEVTPYYNKASQAGLIRHYNVIADAVQIPLVLYDVPSRTGVTIAPETYAELAKHPNINGVKEAAGNLSALQKTRSLCPDDFSIWSGNDDETAAICLLGGKGVISVAANVVPAQMHRLTELCFANDFAAAGRLQLELKDLCDALFCDVNPIPVKTALGLMGWDVGPLRLPLCSPGPAQLARIQSALEQYGLLETA